LFDKWGLPIKKKGIEQPESMEQERLNQQLWSQNTLNLHFTGDPFFTSKPIAAKKWTAAAKSALANFNKK
jgi:hypothetical protein